MPLVAGVDSSTQSCKVVVVDATSGAVRREGRAAHPAGTEVQPAAWAEALRQAVGEAGGLDDVAAVAVAGQQHGMVCLDDDGAVVRPALLWNDTRSAAAATDLVAELGAGDPAAGRRAWADAVGTVPVASITVTKLRWLADTEPEAASRTTAVCLPHDWLTWQLAGDRSLDALVTDRGDASGTGYWSPATGEYRPDLLARALGHEARVPRVAAPAEAVARTHGGAVVGPGTGDNAAAALGLDAGPGDVVVSVGTSGVVSAVSDRPSADAAGLVAGFADATGRFLPLVCTLNAARVLDAAAALLGVDHDRFSDLALAAPAGADGLVLVPYLEGERTPDLPDATGALHGVRLDNLSPSHLARAVVEGVLCGLAAGLDTLRAHGHDVRRVLLVGGGARSVALCHVAPTVFGVPVTVPAPDEYVARGAARQAAWVAAGTTEAPSWPLATAVRYDADPVPSVRDRYAEAAAHVLSRRDR